MPVLFSLHKIEMERVWTQSVTRKKAQLGNRSQIFCVNLRLCFSEKVLCNSNTVFPLTWTFSSSDIPRDTSGLTSLACVYRVCRWPDGNKKKILKAGVGALV